jgi:hypothetical protein
MSDRVNLFAGIAYGLAGLGLLAHADFPVIRDGGAAAIVAGFELFFAMTLLSAALGLATRRWRSPPG